MLPRTDSRQTYIVKLQVKLTAAKKRLPPSESKHKFRRIEGIQIRLARAGMRHEKPLRIELVGRREHYLVMAHKPTVQTWELYLRALH